MTSARRFYRLGAVLAVLGIGAVGLTVTVAVGRVRFGALSIGDLVAACRFLGPHGAQPVTLLVAALLTLAAAVGSLAVRELSRELRAQRRFLAALTPVESLVIADVPVTLVDDDRPQAFCAGPLRPRIYLSTGALALLSDGELVAVAAHEQHHLERRDPLRIFLARVLARSLFFLPLLRRLSDRYVALAELAADDAAVRRAGSRELASAMLAFGRPTDGPAAVTGIAPERVDHLLGERSRWGIPVSLAAGSAIALAALLALALSVPLLFGSEQASIPALLASSCMAAMTVFPLAVAAAAVSLSRSRLLPRWRH